MASLFAAPAARVTYSGVMSAEVALPCCQFWQRGPRLWPAYGHALPRGCRWPEPGRCGLCRACYCADGCFSARWWPGRGAPCRRAVTACRAGVHVRFVGVLGYTWLW